MISYLTATLRSNKHWKKDAVEPKYNHLLVYVYVNDLDIFTLVLNQGSILNGYSRGIVYSCPVLKFLSPFNISKKH